MTLVDRFSAGLDEMRRKDQRDIVKVLQVLERIKRFSVFEASENSAIANTMTKIMQEGYAKSVGGAFPWTEVEITDKGRAAIAEKLAAPAAWDDAQRICNLPQVDEAIRNLLADQTGDNATCLVRAVLEAARPTLMPIAWMTDESKRRLSQGGNAKGTVPVHGKPSVTAVIPLYIAKEQASQAAPNYKRFAIAVLRESRKYGGADVGGAEIQGLAAKHGLLIEREVTEPCGASCECDELGALPCRCFFYAPDILGSLKGDDDAINAK